MSCFFAFKKLIGGAIVVAASPPLCLNTSILQVKKPFIFEAILLFVAAIGSSMAILSAGVLLVRGKNLVAMISSPTLEDGHCFAPKHNMFAWQ